MADCNDLFQAFHDAIKLSASKERDLRRAREALRDRIKNHFKSEMEEKIPEFQSQGSFAMKTIVNPLDGEFDIDDGIYLQNLPSEQADWPTPKTVHGWILDAVEGHTEENPMDKRTCIRVRYAGQYHVDLPIYGKWNGGPYLAEKKPQGWHVSDAQAITSWFREAVGRRGSQLERVVRYLKSWADNNSKFGKLPSGLLLTVLAVPNFAGDERDDAAFARTVRKMAAQLEESSSVPNPTDSTEDLSKEREDQMEKLHKRLNILADNAIKALHLPWERKQEACEIWRGEFGHRFPSCDGLKEDETSLRTSKPARLGRDDARSA